MQPGAQTPETSLTGWSHFSIRARRLAIACLDRTKTVEHGHSALMAPRGHISPASRGQRSRSGGASCWMGITDFNLALTDFLAKCETDYCISDSDIGRDMRSDRGRRRAERLRIMGESGQVTQAGQRAGRRTVAHVEAARRILRRLYRGSTDAALPGKRGKGTLLAIPTLILPAMSSPALASPALAHMAGGWLEPHVAVSFAFVGGAATLSW